MTHVKRKRVLWNEATSILILGITLVFGLALSGQISRYVKEGLELAVRCVIPSSFPFMIVSDFYVCYGRPENIRIAKGLFTSLFGIGHHGLAPFICGNIGGFPIGAKMCADCYSSGRLTKDEAERLMPLSNNPSSAFVVGGIGMGIYEDVRIGILLLVSVYIATVMCGIITRSKPTGTLLNGVNANNSYDFIASVKKSGINSIGIISFISIFSVLTGLTKSYVKNKPLIYIISAFSEVTNAIKMYSESGILPHGLKLVLSAFALGFGGICVGLQSAVFTSSSGLRMRKYYLIKLMEGILSACVFSILYMI